MIRAWRILKARYAATAFDGEGARLYGGRWNSVGRPVVYLGCTPAIAALEVLAHNARPALLEASYVIIEARLPDSAVLDIDRAALSSGWDDAADARSTAAIGDAWLASGASLALRVPSAVLPLERNLVVNVRHPRYAEMQVGEPRPFRFDPRLAGA
ncbi:MAG TPA: RES family NAD+ phosphorylase [Trueperaceae bacterium]|nr:RES family NAD+ phosphorylase [Trueperaceae bacterium]